MEASINNNFSARYDLINKKQKKFKEVWHRLKKNKTAVFGLIVIIIFILIAIFADVIAPYGKGVKMNVKDRFTIPSPTNLFGTDEYGRDVFTRVIHGTRYSLSIGFVATFLSMLFGIPLGSIAGYFGGKVDTIIMRLVDVLTSIPAIMLSLVVVTVFGANLVNLIIAIFIARIPADVRVIRSAVLPLVDQQYIEAAHAGGASELQIIMKHIIPNAAGTIIVQSTMNVGQLIIRASGLSFLGLGVPTPAPEWGTLLSEAREYLRSAPHMMIFPGIALILIALSINLLGDGLRDALDPRLKN